MDLFWTAALILVALWAFGLIGGIGGALINLLVVSALVVVVYRLYIGKNILTGK
jgi:uncharacterized protein DUF5670